MTPLSRVYLAGPLTLHGQVVREIHAHKPTCLPDGTVAPGWALHLHPVWQCVVVEEGEACELVPVRHVLTMTLASAGDVNAPGRRTPGRPRTVRLAMAQET